MSDSVLTTKPTVLIVSDAADEAVEICVSAVTAAGREAAVVPDVYQAVAMLASGDNVGSVILDLRRLDDQEIAFPRLAARYFPGVDIIVPSLMVGEKRPGTSPRSLRILDPASIAASLGSSVPDIETEIVELDVLEPAPPPSAMPTQRPTPPDGQASGSRPTDDQPPPPQPEGAQHPRPVLFPVREIGAEREEGPTELSDENDRSVATPLRETRPLATAPSADAASQTRPPGQAAPPEGGLSTDGGPGAVPDGPSLHEAVRARMAADDPRVIRRPPPRQPPGPTPQALNNTSQSAPPIARPERPVPSVATGNGGQQAPPPPHLTKPTLSAEEVDALFAGDEPEAESPDDPDARDQPGGAA